MMKLPVQYHGLRVENTNDVVTTFTDAHTGILIEILNSNEGLIITEDGSFKVMWLSDLRYLGNTPA